jgi:cytochrome c biogenesis protein CcmG/thiol:disulfide interchange protein DsbE
LTVTHDDEELLPEPRRGHLALVAASIVAVVVVLLVVVLAQSEPAGDRLTDSPLVGEVAPAFTGRTLDGGTFDLDRQQGRWVVVNFFATWCAPCVQEHPELVSFARRHAEPGDAVVVSVAYDDDEQQLRRFFDEHGGEWPVVIEDPGSIALDYGVAGVPESYVIDPFGFVRAKVTGGVTSTGLDRLLDDLAGRGS